MPSSVGSHSQLSKDQLKNVLISHNVPLPQGDQKKEVYLQLYLKHILTKEKEAGDFSSDDEEPVSENDLRPVENEEEKENINMDMRSLSNTELKEQLLKHGVKPGPILPSTRSVYEKRLQKLLEVSRPQVGENGAGDEERYSDSEDEGSQLKNRVEMRIDTAAVNGVHNHSQSNIPASLAAEYNQNLATLGDDFSVTRMLKQMEKRSSSGLSYKKEQNGKSLNPNSQTEEAASSDDFSDPLSQYTLGMSATRRKPIKGAAGRPIQFRYDDITTRARMQDQTKTSEAEKGAKRLVPVSIQIIVFVVIAFIALVFLTMESNPENPFTPHAEPTP
ncbi:LEM domain-containing protein 1 [Discoglossus pictus]